MQISLAQQPPLGQGCPLTRHGWQVPCGQVVWPEGHWQVSVEEQQSGFWVQTPPVWLQAEVHTPPLQCSPCLQTCPHVPQLLGSLLVKVQVFPHWSKPGGHWMPQVPLLQTACPMFWVGHTFPQLPQFRGSELVLAQELLQHLPPEQQSASLVQPPPVGVQVEVHTPPVHCWSG